MSSPVLARRVMPSGHVAVATYAQCPDEDLARHARGALYDAKVYEACPCCRQATGTPVICYGSIEAYYPEDALECLENEFPAPPAATDQPDLG